MSSPNLSISRDNTTSDSRSLKEILRARQAARSRKSCYPCRERKVKCDQKHPCSTCSRRGHPDLCAYPGSHSGAFPDVPGIETATPAKRSGRLTQEPLSFGSASSNSSPTVVAGAPLATPSPLSREKHVARITRSSLLEDNSIVSIAREPSRPSANDPARQSAYETGILPLLGAADEKIVPLPAPWVDHEALYDSLPSDQEMMRLFETHRLRVHPFHIATYDLDRIEKKLCVLITQRKEPNSPVSPELRDARWVCLLHAIFAAGAQQSDFPIERRLALSQHHIKQAFEALRAADYLARPFREALQTLLLLSYVLQNDMKPQAAWVLGGTTIRLALCLGIHRRGDQPRNSSIPPEEARVLRLAIVWQDTLLSLAFDCPPTSHDFNFEDDVPNLTYGAAVGTVTYRQGMQFLGQLGLRYLCFHKRARTAPQADPMMVFQDVELIEANLLPHLKELQQCNTILEIQEHYSYEVHRYFFAATVCRPFMSRSRASEVSPKDRPVVIARVQAALRRSAWAYAHLRSVATYARRAWSFIHNGLASVLLLSLMSETRCDADTRMLQDKFINDLSQNEASLRSESDVIPISYLSDTLKNAVKALQALRRLADQEARGMADDHAPSSYDNSARPPSQPVQNAPENNISRDEENTESTQQTEYENQNPDFHQANRYRIWDADDWTLPVDFSVSPLEAFDHIMADQFGIGDDTQSYLP